MRTLIVATTLVAALSLGACSKPTQDKTAQDLKTVGSEVGSAAKQVAATPAAKSLGSDIKQGASEAAQKMKQGAKDAGAKTDQALDDARDKSDKR